MQKKDKKVRANTNQNQHHFFNKTKKKSQTRIMRLPVQKKRVKKVQICEVLDNNVYCLFRRFLRTKRKFFNYRKYYILIFLQASKFCLSFSVTRTRGPSVSNCKFRRRSVSFCDMASAISISTRLPSICER